jgi:glutamine---fructose-6-phosphate transaminase (isomerizing)
MNLKEDRYKRFALVREMMESSSLVEKFKSDGATDLAVKIKDEEPRFFLTGEGSSRIFPAKRARLAALRRGSDLVPETEGATQALEYQLSGKILSVASNSGKTKEGLRLLRKAKGEGIYTFGLVAQPGSPIAEEADFHHVLTCGKEEAVAATKSVIEQALFYHQLFSVIEGYGMPDMGRLAESIDHALTMAIPGNVTEAIASAGTIYWAGRNDGVAEELTLKSNEITRKKSDFLEGTYAVHGIEEVLNKDDVIILVQPFEEEEKKFEEVLCEGVGARVFALSGRQTLFPTILLPEVGGADEYIRLAAGWNLLVEVGVALGIDLDHPVRARKVGNEMEPA